MPPKKPDAPEEVTVFETIKNRIAERSQLIVELRETIEAKDEEILTLGIRVEDTLKSASNAQALRETAYEAQDKAEVQRDAAVAANAEMQAFIDSIKALPEFADLFPAKAEATSDSEQPA